ncbi:MAG: DUF3040 domain-containing protein [Candidatus Planktophila sp.]|nr:DUF3040 domain-containing protein [Candidatus Planktophila sp.]
MALSDHEKRMLQEMEAALLTEDPRLFSALSGNVRAIRPRSTFIGLGLILLGLITLFTGLIAQITPIGLLGFILALAGVITLISMFGTRTPRIKGARRARGLGPRLQERWDERNNQ